MEKKLLNDKLLDILVEKWMKLVKFDSCLSEFRKFVNDLSLDDWAECKSWKFWKWHGRMMKCNLDTINLIICDERTTDGILEEAGRQMKRFHSICITKEECWKTFEEYWNGILKEYLKEIKKQDLDPIRNWLLSKTNNELEKYADGGNENLWKEELKQYLDKIANPLIVVDAWNKTMYNFLAGICSRYAPVLTANFKQEYLDPFHNVRALKMYVEKCANAYNKNASVYNAPYISICQGSGYGKSRLITELAKIVPLLYMSLLGKNSEGYPARTTMIKKLMFPAEVYPDNDENLTDDSSYTGINERLLCDAARMCQDLFNQYNESVPYDKVDSTFTEVAIKESAKKFRSQNTQPIIVVIDEARELLKDIKNQELNYFRQFRHFLKEHWQEHRIFGILIDTQSRIANFSGPTKFDPSCKALPNQNRLFQPFILMGTLDSKKFSSSTCNVEYNDINQIKAWNDLRTPIAENEWQNINYIKKLGRPMWGGAEITNEFARKKLYAVYQSNRHAYESCLAILFCRLGGLFSPTSKVGPTLVANHMATLLDVDSTRETMLCAYVSDPFLANAAIDEWNEEGGSLLSTYYLPALRTAFLEGAVSQGYLGEYVARIILLLLIDKLRDNQGWVDLKAFLLEFCSRSENLNIPDKAKVGFCHFVMTAVHIQPNTIAYLGQRRAAAMLMPNHPGADILIPYWYLDEQKVVAWSYILVQVKNHQICPEKNYVQNRLHPEYVFSRNSNFRKKFKHDKVICICMCLGCKNNSESISTISKPKSTFEDKKRKRAQEKKEGPASNPSPNLTQVSEQMEEHFAVQTEGTKKGDVSVIWRCGVEYKYGLKSFEVEALRSLLRCAMTVKNWQENSYIRKEGFDQGEFVINPKRCENCKVHTLDVLGKSEGDIKKLFKRYRKERKGVGS